MLSAPRRFYKTAAGTPVEGGWGILLDGKALRSPAKRPFVLPTEALAQAIAASPAFSIAGGGDTVAAIHKFGIADRVSYISTAGGAFLEFLEGKKLPAVAMLETRAQG